MGKHIDRWKRQTILHFLDWLWAAYSERPDTGRSNVELVEEYITASREG